MTDNERDFEPNPNMYSTTDLDDERTVVVENEPKVEKPRSDGYYRYGVNLSGEYREEPNGGYGNAYNERNFYGNQGMAYGNDAYNDRNYNTAPTQVQKKRKFGIGALVVTALITLAACSIICFGIMKNSGLNVNKTEASNNADDFTSSDNTNAHSSTGNFKPDGSASQGLIIGSNATESDDAQASVLEKCRRTVVSINVQTVTNSYYYGDSVSTSAGSGVIVTTDGYIVTCNHVVEGGSAISVSLQDGTTYEAELVGHDSRTDLAILKIDATSLPAATIGDSNTYKVGDAVYAIGNPLGEFASTVTDGIVSGIDRSVEIDGVSMTLMQTNAAINPGNSGGGLFSSVTGELIGIVNAKNYGIEIEGLGFAIPTSVAQSIITDLMDKGYVTGRPYIGVSMQTVTTSGNYGWFSTGDTKVKITAVSDNSPAAAAGIQAGDFFISIDENQIKTSDDLMNILNNYNAGDKVNVLLERNGQQVAVSLVLGEASGN